MSKFVGATKLRNDLKVMVENSPMGSVNLIANKILPETPVTEKTAQVPEQSTGAGMKLLDTKRAPDGSFKRGAWVWGASTYYTYEYGYEEPVDNVQELLNQDIFSEETVAAMVARNQLLLAREKRVADAVFNATTFAAAADSEAADAVWSTAGSNAFKDVNDAYEKLFKKVGKAKFQCRLIINEVVLRNAIRLTQVSDAVKYTAPIENMDESTQAKLLATFFGIGGIDVATSFADTTALGVDPAIFGRLYADAYGLLYIPTPPIPSWKIPGIGRQPVYTRFAKDYIMESYPEERTDSTIVRAREYRGVYLSTKYGVLITTLL